MNFALTLLAIINAATIIIHNNGGRWIMYEKDKKRATNCPELGENFKNYFRILCHK